jgi:hypothetical protein
MIITNVTKLERADVVEFSWFSLRSFHNVKSTADLMSNFHNVPNRHRSHVEKQADQIRFFLLQAKEYFDASRSVTLVTRPVLLYYAVMCLATAEALFKQSGDISLDRARGSHRHHGLSFVSRNTSKNKDDLASQAANGLIALPATGGAGHRYGTFELWHRSARSYPLPGPITVFDHLTQSTRSSIEILGLPLDERYLMIPESGVTLNEALNNIPGMVPLVQKFGGVSNLVRGQFSQSVYEVEKEIVASLVIHPGNRDKIATMFSKCMFNANDIENLEYKDLKNGGIINFRYPMIDMTRFIFPTSSCDNCNFVQFHAEGDEYLNEFGFIYVALYIVGNYARYYPDFWIYDVEKSTQLGLLIEHLLNVAEQRIGLLALSEFSQNFYIPA